ncbi:unnamed protein product [Eruca vesicaria subsp. sativa]|uniref:Uncharacterized protein n=1 Tax=Eruca vesicaria subsp. sativa TaxID=29727 RepID=A0ABC8KIP9_ERUVS|nr:unnamed protein product [Eruca vesicaria subsp. sativa]
MLGGTGAVKFWLRKFRPVTFPARQVMNGHWQGGDVAFQWRREGGLLRRFLRVRSVDRSSSWEITVTGIEVRRRKKKRKGKMVISVWFVEVNGE